MAGREMKTFAEFWPFYVREHSRPATFKHPLWSLAGDYKMVALMLAGRMGEEVARAQAGREGGAAATAQEV